MIQLRVNDDYIEIEGYVNAVERTSKPLLNRYTGKRFVEKIKSGAFERAIERNPDIRLLLNHNHMRDLGGTKDGNLELYEDSIGLKMRAIVRDEEVIREGRNGDLIGFSFGFTDRDFDDTRTDENGMPLREVRDLNLNEISIIDRTRTPAYSGTLLQVRDDGTEEMFCSAVEDEIEVRIIATEQPNKVDIDYTQYERAIEQMKGVHNEQSTY